MPHYCDTKVLESNWFNWLIGECTPSLEPYRIRGLLATKIIVGKNPSASKSSSSQDNPNTTDPHSDNSHKDIHVDNYGDNTTKWDPFWGCSNTPMRSHCIVISDPVFCNSYAGKCDKPRRFSNGRPVVCGLPDYTVQPVLVPDASIISKMIDRGYYLERPTKESWDAILIDVKNICNGISLKFNLPSDDAHEELASEAFMQAVNKIKNKKLVYTPGRAPVFNLLTTTIYRIIYSILNKNTKDRENKTEHARIVGPLTARGQSRSRSRIVTRRVCGSLIACPR